ncbi:hypothetical protein BT69DRAFT_1358271 [Atractiella rhizophila]|nr:hypothetical protein BT69DRAFT_1358271 [Atractiella rhizophila]
MSLRATWYGYVADITDVEKIIHACVVGLLVDMPRRLDEQEREELIQHGTVFVFEEGKSGMMRWTDHLKCGQSRMSGVFLTYTEREYPIGALPLTRASICINRQVSNATIERWHLVAYYNREYRRLPRVSDDPVLKSVIVPFKMYANNSSRNRSGTGGLFGGSSTSSSSKSPPNPTSVRGVTPPLRPTSAMLPGRPTQAQPAPFPSYSQSQAQQQPRPNLFGRSGLPSASTNTANTRLPPMQTRPPAQPQTQPSRPLFGGMRASTPPPQATRPPAQPPSSGGLFGRRAPSPGPQMQQQPQQQARAMFGMRTATPPPPQSQPLRSASPNSSSRSFWGRSSNPSPTSRTSSEYNHSHYQPDDMMDVDREMGGLGIGIQRPSTGMGIGRPRLPSVTGMSGMNGLGSYQRGRRMSVDMRGPDDTEMLQALTRGSR